MAYQGSGNQMEDISSQNVREKERGVALMS